MVGGVVGGVREAGVSGVVLFILCNTTLQLHSLFSNKADFVPSGTDYHGHFPGLMSIDCIPPSKKFRICFDRRWNILW